MKYLSLLSKHLLKIIYVNKTIIFLYSNAAAGAKFVFGDTYEQHFYVFKVCLLSIKFNY